MKALITAGGRATRLRPITYTWNKHLIPIALKPMIFYALEKVSEAGIKEVGIIINPGETVIQKVVGDGSVWGVNISYIEQTDGPKGIAHAVKVAEPFLGNEPFLFYLGDNIILGSIKQFVERFNSEKLNCLLALSKVSDPERFGVPEFLDGRIIRVEEKPANPKSNFAVTGIYIYDQSFFQAFSRIKPSERGEYEISDVHTELILGGAKVGHEEITGWWKDTGKPEDLLEGNKLVLELMAKGEMKNYGSVHPGAKLIGSVHVGPGTSIGEGVTILGPTAIGANSSLEKCFIGPHTSIGNNCELKNSEIENSIVFDNVKIDCEAKIADSLIGAGAHLASAKNKVSLGRKILAGDNAYIEI